MASISALWRQLNFGRDALYEPLVLADLESTSDEPSPSELDLEKPSLRHLRDEQCEGRHEVVNRRPFGNPSRKRVPRPVLVLCMIGSLLYMIILTWRSPSSPETDLVKAGDPVENSTYPDTSIAPVFLHWAQDPGRSDPEADSCRVRVHYTRNRTEAEGVLWVQQMPSPTPDGTNPLQKNIFYSLENSIYYPVVSEARESIRKKDGIVDYEMTYRLSSEVPVSYDYYFIDLRTPAKSFSERKKDKLVAVFISNCHALNDRMKVLKKMMELMPGQIDSYGACENNANIDSELGLLEAQSNGKWKISELNRWARKMTVIKNYKFTIAFENADEEDYVTEKYYQALSAGSIPLHLGQKGHGGFDKFLPAPNSAINVRDYERIEDLVKEVQAIAADEVRFNAMLSWKEKPFATFFQQIVDWGKDSDICRLARLMRGIWVNPYAHVVSPTIEGSENGDSNRTTT